MAEEPEMFKNQPVMMFADQAAWGAWLAAEHGSSNGVWLRLAKKAGPLRSPTYAEALDEALCYGWIDGQKYSYDEHSWLQKFTPRRPKSLWSQVNREKVAALIANGKMRPAGQAEIDRAQADGRWEAAYPSQSTAEIPDDFQAALDAQPGASQFFAGLTSAQRYSFLFRIITAKKAETRAKRIAEFAALLGRGEKLG